jgi:predicted ester cyclase
MPAAVGFVEHEETPGLAPTKEGVLEFFRMYRAAFPDLKTTPEEVLVSGEKTVTRALATGTHEGELMGMPATGRSVEVQLIDIMGFDDAGLISEHWGLVDMLAMMRQLGAIPEGPAWPGARPNGPGAALPPLRGGLGISR